jgi:two-component system, NtrC family, response regulator HydG
VPDVEYTERYQGLEGDFDTQSSVYEVVVVEGPDAGKRAIVDSDRPRLLVGQSPACSLVLADRTVSRRHAAFELSDAGLRLLDLESKNGTYAGGLLVRDVVLAGGELLRMGSVVLRVEAAPRREHAAIVDRRDGFGRVIGASRAMQGLYPLCDKLAISSIPTVIEGETGTGKELLAESLHELGPRAQHSFVVFDCTAVPPTLLESALFGHERGAFTGATSSMPGALERADRGTLLIDEIGELPLELQPKLLRAVERNEVQRVGATSWRKLDVRVIAATRRDLDREVELGHFREDLFFRLAVGRVELPPLRSRRGDVALLAEHFFALHGGTDRDALRMLLARYAGHSWPGNVRELSNIVARQIALGDVGDRQKSAPPEDVVEETLSLGLSLPRARARVVQELERRYVERVLAEHGGHVCRAAASSGIARRYFEIVRARSKRPSGAP